MPQYKKLKFNQCIIDFPSNEHIEIITPDEALLFNEREKRRVFDNGRGESVIEYSGLESDGNGVRSFAKATYQPEGYSQLHYHSVCTENYYILDGKARVILDGVSHELSVGDCITIPVQKSHEVHNITSSSGLLILIVKCTPSWIAEDCHLIKIPFLSF